jgi:predicted TIM-barrel fold metal-dependent hydrolase
MIVDAHTHIIPPVDALTDEHVVSLGSKQIEVSQYVDTFSQLGIQACFTFAWNALYLDSYCRAENEALAKLNQRYPARIYAWGTVSPAWNVQRLRSEIRYAIQDLKLYGLKFVPICQGISLTNPGFDIVAQEAIDLGVPITTHDGSPEYCSAIQVAYYARKYPRLRVLSAHGGLRELWPDLIEAVRSLPNLYICLSGPTQWGIQSLYDALSPEKLLFGSDGGCGPAAITTAYLRRIERLRAPAAHKDMILGENALRFLKGW